MSYFGETCKLLKPYVASRNAIICSLSVVQVYMGQLLQDGNFSHYMSLFYFTVAKPEELSRFLSTVLSRLLVVATVYHFNSYELFHCN